MELLFTIVTWITIVYMTINILFSIAMSGKERKNKYPSGIDLVIAIILSIALVLAPLIYWVTK